MTSRPMRRGLVRAALSAAVLLLAFIGFTGAIARGFGVLASYASSDRPVPELSPLDRGSTLFIAILTGAERGTDAYREIEEQNRRLLGKFNRHPTATLLHVLPAALFMVLATLQLSRGIRSRRIGWHRWSGRFLVVMAIPIGLSGLFFGLLMPFAGALEASAIGLFGAVFLFSVMRGFLAIRKREIERHREWMIRMFSVALGVSMVRVTGALLAILTSRGPEAWFGHSVWIGLGTTFVVAELWIRRTRPVQDAPILAVVAPASRPLTRARS